MRGADHDVCLVTFFQLLDQLSIGARGLECVRQGAHGVCEALLRTLAISLQATTGYFD